LTRLNSDLVTAQRDLAKKNFELHASMTSKTILGLAAHDLRSPLGAIMVYSEFLLDDQGLVEPATAEFLDVIYSSSQFMLHLVDDLLDIATIQAGKLALKREPVDLAALIAQHVARNGVLAARKGITLSFDGDGGPLWATVDGPKIEQVLYNLLSNAIKYSYPGSAVHVRLSSQDGRAIIAVQDEGQGIPEDEQGKLFRAFGRTSVQPTGDERSTGLGLAIVQSIVRGHGGQIAVESAVGRGTTFTITLPLEGEALPAPAGEARPERDDAPPEDGRLRALVADDDPLSRQVAVRLLEGQGYDVRAVPSGRQAVAATREERFDLI
jgi:signal transduction histidine kinase